MHAISIPAGMGDMAVSNSIGSNVFDILIGLGLPWALQTLAVNYGSYVSLHYSYLFTYLFIFNNPDLFRKRKKSKILWILFEKTSSSLCYDMGEVEVNCHWTFPILLRTEICAVISQLTRVHWIFILLNIFQVRMILFLIRQRG